MAQRIGSPEAPPDLDPARIVDRYVDDVIIHGNPRRVAQEILRLREEIGLDHLLCAPLSYQSFLLITDEVIPTLARTVGTA